MRRIALSLLLTAATLRAQGALDEFFQGEVRNIRGNRVTLQNGIADTLTVVTSGSGSHGVFLQSVGGGGGQGGSVTEAAANSTTSAQLGGLAASVSGSGGGGGQGGVVTLSMGNLRIGTTGER